MPCSLPFNIESAEDLLKIGKLRFYKSGKVKLRIVNEKGENIDLLVNKGISNSFYQELVQVNNEGISFLSEI
jgi:hypothetical protein